MRRWLQFVRVDAVCRGLRNCGYAVLLLAMCSIGARANGRRRAEGAKNSAQSAANSAPGGVINIAPGGAIGQIEGNDISVEGGGASTRGVADGTPRMFVASGSVVTVHSGGAKMTLFGGGQVIICGPAKLTMLESGGAMTLALNFGRVRVEIPEKTTLRVFTPTIIATPIEISGRARDVSVGLSLDDSLCVAATDGAMQLEHQFSGEKLIVPQDGEFFLAEGKLVPVAGTRGSCTCNEPVERIVPAAPARVMETAETAPPAVTEAELAAAIAAARAAAPAASSSAAPIAPGNATVEIAAASAAAEPEPRVEFSIPAHANEEHPVAPPAKTADAVAPVPPVNAPVYTVVVPLTFSASAPVPPADPTPDMALLIREAKVSPDFELTGHVAAPEFAVALQHALGVAPGKTAGAATDSNGAGPNPAVRRKRGFWASLKRAFAGGN